MLVLSRKQGEVLLIETPQGTIEVHVVRLGPGAVRIGIQAPPQFNIVRAELTGPAAESL